MCPTAPKKPGSVRFGGRIVQLGDAADVAEWRVMVVGRPEPPPPIDGRLAPKWGAERQFMRAAVQRHPSRPSGEWVYGASTTRRRCRSLNCGTAAVDKPSRRQGQSMGTKPAVRRG